MGLLFGPFGLCCAMCVNNKSSYLKGWIAPAVIVIIVLVTVIVIVVSYICEMRKSSSFPILQ